MDLTVNTRGQPSLKGFCDHCGNITFQTIVSKEVSKSKDTPVTYTFSRCTICDGMALREHPGDWTTPKKIGDERLTSDIPFRQLWPPTTSFSSEVPKRIRTIYDEARRVRRQSPSSFVVQLRRSFEALVKDRQAEGRTLYAQVQWMIDHDQLPNVFAEMMQVARMIGNLGAHDAEKDVTDLDAEVSDQFFRAIIEYIYIAPALLERVKTASRPYFEPN
jgi:hypothetical protein